MGKKPHPLFFNTSEERDAWIIANVDYYTVLRYRPLGQSTRLEVPTLSGAITEAERIVASDRKARIMIYAVHESHDAFMGSVNMDGGEIRVKLVKQKQEP